MTTLYSIFYVDCDGETQEVCMKNETAARNCARITSILYGASSLEGADFIEEYEDGNLK